MAVTAFGADITGKWTASFDTQIGTQDYTYDFKAAGGTLTGRAKSNIGEGDISEGKINGDQVSFVEMLKFEDQLIRIEYTGKVAGDEIRFTRKVGEFATEELVAKRVK
jgi:hypothetical protein